MSVSAVCRPPPWIQEEEDVQEDEWFFQSIKRYSCT